MIEPAKRYGFALVHKPTNEIVEVRWTRAQARDAQKFRPEADELRIERVRVLSCVKRGAP